jgi:hypothetical protein
LFAVPAGHVPVGVDVEVGVEFPVDDRKDVAVEPCCHSGRVVIGRDESAGVLDQVGAQQQAVTRPHHPGQRGEELRTRLSGEITDRRAQEHEQPPPAIRDLRQVLLEIATDSGNFDIGILTLNGRPRRRQHVGVDIERHEPA